MDWYSFSSGGVLGIGLAFSFCTIFDRGIRRSIAELQVDIDALEKRFGPAPRRSGLRGLPFPPSLGPGDGDHQERQAADFQRLLRRRLPM